MGKASIEEIMDDVKVNLNDQPLPFTKLLSYADALDYTLMALASLGSIIHGLAQPLGYLLLGKAIDAFGTNIHDDKAMVKALYE
nr:ABC transporter B family member 19-like [Tanacetum cinerariifolium]